MSKKSLLWLGSGEIAKLTIPSLLERYEVTTVSRRAKDLPASVVQSLLDIGDRSDFEQLLKKVLPRVVVVTLSPGVRSKEAYKTTYFDSMQSLAAFSKKNAWQPELILYVSSSGVYGQENGEWIDESSATQPASETAQVLLNTERCISKAFNSYCIVRFSGIYGRDRRFLQNRLMSQNLHPAKYSNRIHVEDCAGVISFLLGQPLQSLPTLLLASDDEPERLDLMARWLKNESHYEKQISGEEQPGFEDELLVVKGKRCSNKRLKSLGYVFKYPSYREGYTGAFQQSQQSQQ